MNEQYFSEQEKARRWVEIKERQQILMKEATEAQMPAHIDQIMRSGFTMNDIKGMKCVHFCINLSILCLEMDNEIVFTYVFQNILNFLIIKSYDFYFCNVIIILLNIYYIIICIDNM